MVPQTGTNQNRNGPLDGILVLDHTSALAGPYCTQLLGDLGAKVIKIERPGVGDQSRGWGPPFLGNESAYFLGTNRNKLGLTLDLSQKDGQAILRQLLERADVLVHNMPAEATRRKLHLDEESCRETNPKLIWANITGFGNTGPYAGRPGYDLVAQGMSGTMAVTGEEDSPPTRFPTAIADISAGIYCVIGVISALFARERSGQGQTVDTSLLDSQLTWLSYLASSHFATGDPVEKVGNAHPSIVPYQPFPTADLWIIIGVGTQRQWQRLLGLLELPELGEDARFVTNADRLLHRDELVPLLAQRFKERPSNEWLAKLETAGIPAGPIYKPEDSLKNEQVLARQMIVEIEHPLLGTIKSLGNPIKLGTTPVSYRLPPPGLGEHNDEILSELGYSKEQIDNLRASKVI